jgi:hypothetical protein
MNSRAFAAGLGAAVLAAGLALTTPWVATAHTRHQAATSTYEPNLNPADFSTHIDNPYFPLPVGRKLVYKGVKDGVSQTETVHVTKRTKLVAEGIRARVVTDVAKHGSKLLEKTEDYYAQDKHGNVWYVGEKTAAYENGKVDRSGSWQAGVRDGEPGIIMPAHPHIPKGYRQEFSPADGAQDTAWTVQRGGAITVPYGRIHHILVSLEASRAEPGAYDKKVYGPGVGIVFEKALTQGPEVARLVRVTG